MHTNSSKTINPTGDGIASEPNTSVIGEVIAVLSDEVVCIASVLYGELLHRLPDFLRTQLTPPNQDRLPESEPLPLALLRLSLEDPSARVLVCPICVLHPMNCKFITLQIITN